MEENFINITDENYAQYIPLDPIAFSMADGGAMGSPGEVIIVDKESKIYRFWLQGIECENAKRIIPPLFETQIGMRGHSIPAPGWHYFDLGAGNHLLIKDFLYNDFYPEVQEYMNRPALLYQRWLKLVLAIMRFKK